MCVGGSITSPSLGGRLLEGKDLNSGASYIGGLQ